MRTRHTLTAPSTAPLMALTRNSMVLRQQMDSPVTFTAIEPFSFGAACNPTVSTHARHVSQLLCDQAWAMSSDASRLKHSQPVAAQCAPQDFKKLTTRGPR